MWETRCQIREMLKELNLTQRWLCAEINRMNPGYHTNPTEVCNALKGVLVTPKGNRIVADAYSILTKQKEKASRHI